MHYIRTVTIHTPFGQIVISMQMYRISVHTFFFFKVFTKIWTHPVETNECSIPHKAGTLNSRFKRDTTK